MPETYFFSIGYTRNELLERMKKELNNTIDYEWEKEIIRYHIKISEKQLL